MPGPSDAWSKPAVEAAVRLVFLTAGVSYYKTAAPPVIDVGDIALSRTEQEFLRALYVDGLGEFSFVNQLDFEDLKIVGSAREPARIQVASSVPSLRPLVPFGGGIDSIVVAEQVRARCPDASLFIVSREGDRFAAIENAAHTTQLPVIRAERELDAQVLRSRELGFLNGHVPVTAILSSIATLAAVLHDRDAVIMSNEWSASVGTRPWNGREVNHQWSKSQDFENLFRAVLSDAVPGVEYFSALRPYSELWVARRFAELDSYHPTFRSCNRAFALDPSQRLDRWCGECDKCCFIDLILSPFLPAARLREIFSGTEPLNDRRLESKFRSLLGDPAHVKPFECVGEENECRAAVLLAADRPDRRGAVLLQKLATEIRLAGPPYPDPDALMRPMGPSFIDSRYVDSDVVV
ncbi:MAG: UDP-N-acetyl-alpha-D-muramoyl-L-alanyl-L-glutamate epimerase [Frankiaceae bacterium]|nr:UDP-N-acetyl-alpha-D-muramoyl-L-alanyl-L-glutamate epimerase [Frankiaceae bacterium]